MMHNLGPICVRNRPYCLWITSKEARLCTSNTRKTPWAGLSMRSIELPEVCPVISKSFLARRVPGAETNETVIPDVMQARRKADEHTGSWRPRVVKVAKAKFGASHTENTKTSSQPRTALQSKAAHRTRGLDLLTFLLLF